ncbi:MAG: hypothetical protein ABI867_35530 [Kofleriaceae bacterium]
MRVSWLLVFACWSCAGEDFEVTDDVEVPADDGGKADADSELRVRAGDTTLWIDRAIERVGADFVVHGRTSRNITDGNAFIFDDVFGEFHQQSARTYQVVFRGGELPGFVDGVNLFTALHFTHSSSRPDALTARVTVRPRLAGFTGSSSLNLTAELTPVIVAGRTVYRISGRSTKPVVLVESTAGTVRLVDPTHYEIDLDFDQLVAQTAAGVKLTVTAGTATKTAQLGLTVKKLGLTSGDIEVVFPSPTCTAARLACLGALPDGALDLASCGPALEVKQCNGRIGAVIDGAAADGAVASADARLATPGFVGDATALAGTDRVTAFTTALRGSLATEIQSTRGLWLVSQTARATVLASTIDGAFDAAYARPLALLGAPHAPVPDNVAAARQVAADALLAYLATQDYLHSEFGRSYDALTKELRSQHVQSLREFRETSTPESFPSIPNIDFYVGQWIGTHTEIQIDRTTGAAVNVLVEID